MTLTPSTVAEVQDAMAAASADGTRIVPTGGGTRRRPVASPGGRLLSTAGLADVLQHVPAELTATVQSGVPVSAFAKLLEDAGQWWPQADHRPGSTVGGVVAAAASSRYRLRYGPVRDSLLEVVLVTGDGRLVKGGGPTVKSVAGYDIPRLAAGSLGTVGVIVQVTVKLTPLPPLSEWFHVEEPLAGRLARADEIARTTFRPEAILLTSRGLHVRLAGPSADVLPPAGMTTSTAPPEPAGDTMVHVGVPPARLVEFVTRVDNLDVDYIAEFGTGICDVAVADAATAAEIAESAVRLDGHAVITTDGGAPAVHAAPRDPRLRAVEERLRTVFDPRGTLRPPDLLETAR